MNKLSIIFVSLVGLAILAACQPVCIDSDKGDDFYVAGYRINNNEAYADYGRSDDYCIQSPEINDGWVISDMMKKVDSCTEDCYVIEYHCAEDLSFAHIGFKCPHGCRNGACLKE